MLCVVGGNEDGVIERKRKNLGRGNMKCYKDREVGDVILVGADSPRVLHATEYKDSHSSPQIQECQIALILPLNTPILQLVT